MTEGKNHVYTEGILFLWAKNTSTTVYTYLHDKISLSLCMLLSVCLLHTVCQLFFA